MGTDSPDNTHPPDDSCDDVNAKIGCETQLGCDCTQKRTEVTIAHHQDTHQHPVASGARHLDHLAHVQSLHARSIFTRMRSNPYLRINKIGK